MEQIDKLIKAFAELTIPTNFVKTFNDINEFKDWCHGGSIEDLEHALATFKEYEEVYEYCGIILEVIRQKKINKNC